MTNRSSDSPAAARVRRALMRKGVSSDEIDRAVAGGYIELLAVEVMAWPGPAKFSSAEVAERSGLSLELVERLWRALGFPAVPAGEAVYSEADVRAFKVMRSLIDKGVAEEAASVQLARVVGSSMARLAEAMVGARASLRSTDADRFAYAEAILASRDNVLDDIAELLEVSWRRHLQASARRGMTIEPGEDGISVINQSVGFADLVGYTAMSQQLSEEALAIVVGRFQELAYDVVVAAGGRVIKTIGDEVMYVAEDPATAVRVALALSEAYADDDLLSQVRVGLATGPVLAKDGDYYGQVVNLASRLVNVAYPGMVVVSSDMHDALAANPDVAWRALRPRRLKDIGTVPIWAVYRAGQRPPPGSMRKRFAPLRAVVAEAGLQRAERRAVVSAVDATLEAAEAAADAASDAADAAAGSLPHSDPRVFPDLPEGRGQRGS